MKKRLAIRIILIGLLCASLAYLFWNATSSRIRAEEASPSGDAPEKSSEAPAPAPVEALAQSGGGNEKSAANDAARANDAVSDTAAGASEAPAADAMPDDAEVAPMDEGEARNEVAGGTDKTPQAPGAKSSRPPKRTPKPRDSRAAVKPKGPVFDDFRIVVDRNIFSSKRVPKAAAQQNAAAAAPKPQAPTVRLMGAYLTPERTLALFEGTAEILGGGLKPGESIAGYRIDEVRVDAVVLSNDKGKIDVPIGAGLTKKDDGTWTLVDSPVVAQNNSAPAAGADTTASGGKTDDAAEKLRARRRKELGQ